MPLNCVPEAGDAVADAHVALGEGGKVLSSRNTTQATLFVLPGVEVWRSEDGVLEPVHGGPTEFYSGN